MYASIKKMKCEPLTADTINDLAAISCSRAMAEILTPGAANTRVVIGPDTELPALQLLERGPCATFEIGFGSSAKQFSEPCLRLSALKELFSGTTLTSVPMLLPTITSSKPLAASIADSFPILIRGTISKSDLQMNWDDYPPSGSPAPQYREARGTLRALNVQEIRLCYPKAHPDSDYSLQIQDQIDQKIHELRGLFPGRSVIK